MNEMKILIRGFGTVGQEVARVLDKKRNVFKDKFGLKFDLVGVEDSKGSALSEDGLNIERLLSTKKKTGSIKEKGDKLGINEINYDLLIECTPTNIKDGEPGLSNILNALKDGNDVITSNKGPLALKWNKLAKTAEKNNAKLKFEATVGGAIPIINLAENSLASNKISSIIGILNGTCNYILTRMAAESLPYEHVLNEAQDLGIAESDPTYDVEGIDTALKMVIIANSILGAEASYQDVDIKGIKEITTESLELAEEKNKTIKLLGKADKEKIEVEPRMVPKDHPLSVGGTLNIATLETDLAGEITVTGKGAGASETASSVISDLIEIWKERN
ncbi:MAG: Homoserine dehydrogenase ThrA [Candidatus Methanohalarchaeum thermophilum]|uniref:Homoserine dehydrogenase n=1 Tax=Methanohalarchaeum thermophilum TaxID=1903181 RepID=A0A1Q6DUF1_METT1|nr:MAG: Homoserine dehydrogenase ThrA [Candidatus Methanohalarchaeum thermophilum]